MTTPNETPDCPPSEADCLRQGRDCVNISNGSERDYEQAAEWMQRGHELGYLNCTAELCDCYASGYGVPRDFDRALELARELVSKGFAPGWKYLALAYAEGHGVPLDREKAADYARHLLAALARPVAGVDAELRYSSLLDVYCVLNSLGVVSCREEYLRVARECLMESDQPGRYAHYASALLYRMGDREMAEGDWEEVLGYLEKGAALGHGLSQYVLATLLAARGEVERVPGLLLEASRYRQPAAVGDLLRLGILQEEDAEQFNNIYWALCNHGAICIPRADSLPCQMRLLHSPFVGEWQVHADPRQNISPISARLAIVNVGEETLSGLSLRLCSADAGVDFCLGVAESLEPGSAIEPELAEFEQKAGKPFGKEFYVELSDGTRRAELTLSHSLGLEYFHKKVDMTALPYELWWERGLFGSLVLCVRCTKGELHDFTVARRQGGAVSAGHTLREGEVKRFGRLEFRSFRGLAPGEELGVYCEEFPAVWVQLGE